MLRAFTTFLSFVLIFVFTASPALAAKDGFSKGATTSELRDKYEEGTIRILIAAGHEPLYGGAIYQGVYEREIVADIAEELEQLLERNAKFEVVVTRTNERWNKTLERYFDKQEKKIKKFVKDQKRKMAKLVKKGDVEEKSDANQVAHNAAPEDVALRLYGINKWANENDIDLVVNLHVNDATDHGPDAPSQYTGFSIYVPDKAYGNSRTSRELGRDIKDRLEELSNVSTYPPESAGIVPDRELIAVGAFGTLNVPSVLIEYGYITEPRFALTEYRQTVTKDTAYQTYLALQDFFGDPVDNPRKVATLPTTWPEPVIAAPPPAIPIVPVVPIATTSLATTTPALPAPMSCTPFTKTLALDIDTLSEEVKQLQRILAKDAAIYPEARVTGYFGPATERAVKRFQERNGIVSSGTPETTGYGVVGPRTAAALIARCATP